MKEVRVGRLTLCALDDGTMPFPARPFFGNVAESQWRQHVEVDDAGKILVGHNYALIEDERALIVVDTGYGDDTHGGHTGHLLADFARTGYRRKHVTAVVMTHAHGDHIKRNTVIAGGRRQPTFPRARYHLARADWEWFGGPDRTPEFDEHVVTLQQFGLLALVDGDAQLTPAVSLRSTPGHTPGHTSVVLESEGETAIVLGDLCHLPVHFAHPDWTSTFDTHPDLTPRTRAELFALAIERDALILCPHAPSPGFGHLVRSGDGFRWDPLVTWGLRELF